MGGNINVKQCLSMGGQGLEEAKQLSVRYLLGERLRNYHINTVSGSA